MYPALACGFLTTVPPGKPCAYSFLMKVLVPSALFTFLSSPSSRKASPRNQPHFHVNIHPLVFFQRVISSLSLFSYYGTKVWCLQTIFQASEKDWRDSFGETLGQRLWSLLVEAGSGRLLLQLPSVPADKQAAAGLLTGTMENRVEHFRKYPFWACAYLKNCRMME